MVTRMLEELTLEAVKVRSIVHDMQRGEKGTHFNPYVTWMQRLATLGDEIGLVFKAATIDRVAGTDTTELQAALISLAADALTWAEVLDKHDMCTCPWVRAMSLAKADPCPLHPEEFARRMAERQ